MRLLIFLLSASTCFGQLTIQQMEPFFKGASTSSAFIPTSITNNMLYWFELTPTNSQRLNTDGSGGVPGDATRAGSWINLAHNNEVAVGDALHYVTNYVSGGGRSGTSPRLLFNAGIGTRYIPPAPVSTLTNFTAIIVCNVSNAATASQELFGNANNPPYLDFNANKLTMNAGSAISGATSIANATYYIITWIQAGASSEIDTNGVLYVSGNSGTTGFTGSQSAYIGHDRVNQFVGNVSRIWCWTNTVNSADLSSAITQCKTDFGFP